MNRARGLVFHKFRREKRVAALSFANDGEISRTSCTLAFVRCTASSLACRFYIRTLRNIHRHRWQLLQRVELARKFAYSTSCVSPLPREQSGPPLSYLLLHDFIQIHRGVKLPSHCREKLRPTLNRSTNVSSNARCWSIVAQMLLHIRNGMSRLVCRYYKK